MEITIANIQGVEKKYNVSNCEDLMSQLEKEVGIEFKYIDLFSNEDRITKNKKYMNSKMENGLTLVYIVSDKPRLVDIDISTFPSENGLLFEYYEKLVETYGPVKDWDVSWITNMYGWFSIPDKHELSFMLDDILDEEKQKNVYTSVSVISNWDVSSVEDFGSMFENLIFFDISIEHWNMSSAITLDRMFYGCTNFNQPVDNWDVSNVKNMSFLFTGCENFNQSLNNWDVSNVKNMNKMFKCCEKFNQPLNFWDVSNVNNMIDMFSDCKKFNGTLDGWDVSDVIDMRSMFKNSGFKQSIKNWKPLKGVFVDEMFRDVLYPFKEELQKVFGIERINEIFYENMYYYHACTENE